MPDKRQPKRKLSPLEIQAYIWRTVDQDAIAHRGDPIKQEAERVARRELRRAIDDSKVRAEP